MESKDHERILSSNVFGVHRQTVLDLLIQIQYLFEEFTRFHRVHQRLEPIRDEDTILESPERDAKQARFPLDEKNKSFVKRAMRDLKKKSKDGFLRLRWSSFDKEGFETLLGRFSGLNDKMAGLLDHNMQQEIRDAVADTNRGVLVLHHQISDLSHLVHALKSQLDAGTIYSDGISVRSRKANAEALQQLSRLVKFKAFNENMDATTGLPLKIEEEMRRFLDIPEPEVQKRLRFPARLMRLLPVDEYDDPSRCMGILKIAKGPRQVWIEWKTYDPYDQQPGVLSKQDIIDRVQRLAALLNHSPKPDAFRTLHCLGYFDKAEGVAAVDASLSDCRIGLVFERPQHDDVHPGLPPLSLRELMQDPTIRKPRVTERVAVARALSNCLLYMHAVNWLHKGLRSHNILFFRDRAEKINYNAPYVSGFDYSRPGGSDEMTDIPLEDAEHDLYRHPLTQACNSTNRERSKRIFDVYSLGVILTELAHWQTIEDVLDIEMRRARGNPELLRAVKEKLLEEDRIWDIGAAMGYKFEQAARSCLMGARFSDSELQGLEDTDEGARRLAMWFYDAVVRALEGIAV